MKNNTTLRVASSHNWFSYKLRNFLKKKTTKRVGIAVSLIVTCSCGYIIYNKAVAKAPVAKAGIINESFDHTKLLDNDMLSVLEDRSTEKFSIDKINTSIEFWNGKPARRSTKVEGKMLLSGENAESIPGHKNDLYFTNTPIDTVIMQWAKMAQVSIDVKSLDRKELPKTYTGYLSDFMLVLAGVSKNQQNEATFVLEKTD